MTPMQSTAKNRCSKRAELHRHALNPMSALGQKRTCEAASGMSALPPKADIDSFRLKQFSLPKITLSVG